MQKIVGTLLLWILGFSLHAHAQEGKSSPLVSRKSDQMQIDWTRVQVDRSTQTVQVYFRLTNLLAEDRELKINVFASQLVDKQGVGHLFTTLQLGRVTVQLKDRQNYMHYLLPSETPIEGVMRIEGFQGNLDQIQAWKLVFEDRLEPGRFIEILLPYAKK
jgi:hypothetical protein